MGCYYLKQKQFMKKTIHTNTKKCVTLSLSTEPGSKVCVAGSFNNWAPDKKVLTDKLGDGVYSATMLIPPGIHEYKFVVNGVWTLDPDPNRHWTRNGLGTLNNVLQV